MMRRHGVILILLLLFILEGSLFPWIIPINWEQYAQISPHFVLIFIIYIAIFHNRHSALLLGLIFGFLQDIVYYGHMLGFYSFSLGLCGYFIGLAIKMLYPNFLYAITMLISGLLLYEAIHFGVFTLFRIMNESLVWTFMHQMLPSLLFNLLFALLIYIPARNLLDKGAVYDEEED